MSVMSICKQPDTDACHNNPNAKECTDCYWYDEIDTDEYQCMGYIGPQTKEEAEREARIGKIPF